MNHQVVLSALCWILSLIFLAFVFAAICTADLHVCPGRFPTCEVSCADWFAIRTCTAMSHPDMFFQTSFFIVQSYQFRSGQGSGGALSSITLQFKLFLMQRTQVKNHQDIRFLSEPQLALDQQKKKKGLCGGFHSHGGTPSHHPFWSDFHGFSPTKTNQLRGYPVPLARASASQSALLCCVAPGSSSAALPWEHGDGHGSKLVGGLVAIFYFPRNIGNLWECHHPNWRTHIFQRGGPTTNQ